MPPKITRVRHVALGVESIDDTLRFYRDTLGLLVVADDVDESGQRRVTLPAGLSAVVLIEEGLDRGVAHVAFDTDDASLPRAGHALDPAAHLGAALMLYPPITPPPAPTGHVLNIDHVVVSSGDSATVAAHFRVKGSIDFVVTARKLAAQPPVVELFDTTPLPFG